MMYLKLIIFILSTLMFKSCNETNQPNESIGNEVKINCTNEWCQGIYKGPEFINGSDIAHQYSNKMSAEVGDKLKELYDNKKYSKVDLRNISMTTEGMGTGNVSYELKIPFIHVSSKCEAYTSFDHVGGWNHTPELENRKNQLSKLLISGDQLDISQLKRTKEGLQEYWIQWRHKEKQSECVSIEINR